jgi:FdhD protein
MSVRKVEITRIRSDDSQEILEDSVASDVALCIFVNGEFYKTLISSPGMFEELVVGHLYSEGVVSSPAGITELIIKPERVDVSLRYPVKLFEITMEKNQLLTTACAGPTKIMPCSVKQVQRVECLDTSLIRGAINELNKLSSIFIETGGTHSALIYHVDDGVVAFAEDVGRHNALDKVIGRCLLDAVDFDRCVLASSGRLAGEMVLKAAVTGIPVVCSVSAPLFSGIRIAAEANIRLVGFVRGRRMNVYT